jgi:hypothetical protein
VWKRKSYYGLSLGFKLYLITYFEISLYSLPLIAVPSIAALSHKNPASAGTSRGNCFAQDSDKRNALYMQLTTCALNKIDVRI